MRKFTASVVLAILFMCPLHAQEKSAYALSDEGETIVPYSWYISVQGGEMFSYGENAFTYFRNGAWGNLLNPMFTFNVGRGIGNIFEGRASLSYGINSGACNSLETSGGGFYPYSFNSLNLFADLILKGVDKFFPADNSGIFFPKVYLGAGAACTFGFSDSGHPWQKVSDKNLAFGVRAGFIGEYDFSPHFGVYLDICAEAYTDNYNGLKPSQTDQDVYENGYAGFPVDLRGILALGVIYRFK